MGGYRNVPRSPRDGQHDDDPIVRRMMTSAAHGEGHVDGPIAVDTRSPAGPRGRVYAVPFAGVWDCLVSDLAARNRWDLVHRDEDLGLITVACRGWLRGRADDVTIWVRLDANGLTRVDVRTESRRGAGAGERRIRDLFDRLDQALGREARVHA